MGIALKSLDAMKLGTVGVNLGNVEAYRAALKGLSVEQSVFALASKGATEEQIRQILVTDQAKLKDVEAAIAKAGLTTATKALNAEELIALATKKGISVERAKEIASALGLIATEKGQIVSKKQLTVATLQQVGATDAEITAILGLNAAETTNIGITNVLTASFAKLWAVITAHPIGAILTAIGVVAVGAVAAYNKWGDTLENTKEKLSDLKSECREIVSDLQAVNSELETTQQRLKELEGKDALTFTEKEEYDNLVKINNELQRKIDLLELEEKNKRKEQNKAFVSAMEKDTENPFEHEVNPDGKNPAGQYSISDEYLTSETGYINAQFEIREKLLDDLANAETEKEKERIQKRIDEINSYLEDKNTEWKTVSDGIDYIENPTTEDDKAVNEWLDYIADFQDRMAIAMSKDDASSNAQYKTNTFNRVVDNWQFDETVQDLQDLGKEGKVTAEMLNDPKYDEFINKLVFLGVIDSADNLDDIALAFNSVAIAAGNASDTTDDFANKTDILSISETIDKVNTQLKPSLDSLKTVYQSVFSSDGFTLDDVDVSMLESLKSSLADLKENGIDVTTEDFENFARVITDSSTEETQAQEAFDQLATTLVNSSKATLVSDDAFNTLVQTLEQLGITNAEEALQGLRDIQSEIASKGYDLANITNEQAAAFINEGNASAEAVTYLQYYMIQKQLAEQPLKTSADIKALEDLCNSLGITGEMYQEVIKLKTMMNEAEAGAGVGEFDSLIAESKAKIEDLAKNQYTFGFKFEPTVDKDKVSGSAKDIAEEFKNLLDAELKVLDTKMDAGLINFNDYIAQRLALIQKYYDEGKIKAADYYEYLSKHYETQLSYMDKVSSYVTTTIDKQIDAYNKQIEQIKDRYQSEIDYLDTVIEYYENQKTALQDANNERDRQLALQKALYDLEKAQTQRTIKLYADNHGYIYRADGDAIRDAQDQVDKAKLDIQIAEIDKAIKKVQEQQDALKKAMDKEVEAINKIIENLEAYKEKWNSVAKEYEERQNEMIAQQMYGADIEKEILAGRLEVLEDFKNKYLAIQQAIKDANANAAQAALNDAKTPTTSGGGGTNNSSGNGSTTKTPVISDAEKKRIQEENKKKKYTGDGGKNLVAKYASGTKNAKQGIHEVAEDGDEIIRDNYGNAYIAKGHQLHNFEGGETVYDAEETKKLLGGRLVPVENIIGLNESATNLLSLSKNPELLNLKPQFQSFDFSFLKDIGSTSSNEQVVVTQNVNVTLPNITNESGFNNFKKELDRLKLDAYQFANKRIK